MWVKFTKKVEDLFGGVYQNEKYIAHEDTVLEVPDDEYRRLIRDFPGLVKKANAAEIKKATAPPAPAAAPAPSEEGEDD